MGELTGELTAWLILFLCFLIVSTSRSLRNDGFLLAVVWGIIFTRFCVGLYNVYVGTTFGADFDAIRLQGMAVNHAENGTTPDLMEFGLGGQLLVISSAYKMFGISLLLGQTLSTLAFTISLVALNAMIDLLARQDYRRLILILYGLLPTGIMFGAVIMRESYQQMIFLSAVLFGLRYHLKGQWMDLGLLILSSFLLCYLHVGFTTYFPFLILLFVFWRPKWVAFSGWRFISIKRLLTACLVLGPGVFMIGRFAGSEDNLKKVAVLRRVVQGDGLEYVSEYRNLLAHDTTIRTNYGVNFHPSNPVAAASLLPVMFSLYMFSPMPWQVRGLLEVYAFFESLIRFLLFVGAVVLIWKAPSAKRGTLILVFLAYLSLSALWSLGTTNYGTGMRHHLVGFGLLLILGAPFLSKFLLLKRTDPTAV